MLFNKKLLAWFQENGRNLPWRGINDPYKIWLSEIILQQTRIEQGRDYYMRFTEQYPTVTHLANASEEEVLKTWQGLGYYSRARNLHASAQFIANQLNGQFPNSYEGLLQLKGVGKYTAAAIASFAYRLPYPVIDGNVYRFISRLYGIDTPIGTDAAYKQFETLLLKLIDKEQPDLFNHAMMDFGSTYCKPTGCNCKECIFQNECVAWKTQRVEFLPVKGNTVTIKHRWFYYYFIVWEQQGNQTTMLHRREGKDIWKGLYEFPLIETNHALTQKELHKQNSHIVSLIGNSEAQQIIISAPIKHQLTHRTIQATFIYLHMGSNIEVQLLEGEQKFSIEEAKKLPISRLIDIYTQQIHWMENETHKQLSDI